MDTKIIFTVLVVVLYNVLSLDAATTRVVGGHEAPVEFGRFHASLQSLSGNHVCGGAVVSDQHIVTAAHCLYEAEPQYIKAVVGTTNLDVGGQQYDVVSIDIHEGYNYSIRTNDIAILKINGIFDPNYVDILSLHKTSLVEGDIVVLSGFGANQPNGESSRQLYSLELPVFNQDTCVYAMRYSKNVTESMFCTFTQIGEGTCHGDSGGPLVKENQLVGLVSWGIPCAIGFPDVHTRITPYIDWIQEMIK